ncbi:MAG: hypothetical protein JXI32_00120, partial [Deltaproteobacteria bacterium]|nr:hypothetical protein [Deltaproteobacteria bacterium]
FGPELCGGAIEKLDLAIGERVKRLGAFAKTMAKASRLGEIPGMASAEADLRLGREVADTWPRIETCFREGLEEAAALDERDRFLAALRDGRIDGAGYVETIRSLQGETKALGTAWLRGIIDRITREAFGAVLPLCQ